MLLATVRALCFSSPFWFARLHVGVKLAQSPYLSELFTETDTSTVAAEDGTRDTNFLPLLVLKHLFGTQKPAVYQKAAECLKMILALQTETINTVLLRTGVAADVMAHRLIELQAALPMEMENEDTHQHIVEWMSATTSPPPPPSPFCRPRTRTYPLRVLMRAFTAPHLCRNGQAHLYARLSTPAGRTHMTAGSGSHRRSTPGSRTSAWYIFISSSIIICVVLELHPRCTHAQFFNHAADLLAHMRGFSPSGTCSRRSSPSWTLFTIATTYSRTATPMSPSTSSTPSELGYWSRPSAPC